MAAGEVHWGSFLKMFILERVCSSWLVLVPEFQILSLEWKGLVLGTTGKSS